MRISSKADSRTDNVFTIVGHREKNPLTERPWKRLFLASLLLTASILSGCSTSEWIEVNCPGEHVATRLPTDPASTYRHYGSVYESGYRATETALTSLIAELPSSDTLNLMVPDFRKYLTGERAAVEYQMAQAVTQLQSDPCDDKARAKFQFLIQYVNFNGKYLHKIAAACRDTSANLRSMLEDYRRERN